MPWSRSDARPARDGQNRFGHRDAEENQPPTQDAANSRELRSYWIGGGPYDNANQLLRFGAVQPTPYRRG